MSEFDEKKATGPDKRPYRRAGGRFLSEFKYWRLLFQLTSIKTRKEASGCAVVAAGHVWSRLHRHSIRTIKKKTGALST